MHTWALTTWEAEAGELWVQEQPQLVLLSKTLPNKTIAYSKNVICLWSDSKNNVEFGGNISDRNNVS